jgi:hypothetical protein
LIAIGENEKGGFLGRPFFASQPAFDPFRLLASYEE